MGAHSCSMIVSSMKFGTTARPYAQSWRCKYGTLTKEERMKVDLAIWNLLRRQRQLHAITITIRRTIVGLVGHEDQGKQRDGTIGAGVKRRFWMVNVKNYNFHEM